MTRTCDSLNSAIVFCRLFGLGPPNNYAGIACFNDTLLLLLNLFVSVCGSVHITYYMSDHMPPVWNITTVVSMIRVYINTIAPPLTVLFAQFKKRAFTDCVAELEDLVPWMESDFLRSFVRYSVKWLLMNMSTEIVIITTLHFFTGFSLFAVVDYLIIAIHNAWLVIPLLQFVFIIKTVRLGVCEINRRVDSVGRWKIYRQKWKELARLAMRLTENVAGDIIIIHFTSKIADIVFFIFTLYVYGLKRDGLYLTIFHVYNIVISSFWVFELFRQCQNCKQQVMLFIIKTLTSHNNFCFYY